MKKVLFFSLILLLALLLGACGVKAELPSAPAAAPSSEPTPSPTPEPTPAPTPEPTEWVLSGESAEEILALADISALRLVDGTASQEYAAMLELSRLRPDCQVLWNYEFEGVLYPNTAAELKAAGLDGLEDAVRYLPALSYIDVIDTPATVEDLDRLYDINPDAFYYWSFVHDGFTIRTDIQVYSSLRDGINHRFTSEELYPMLKYCKHMKALDLGHNNLTDLTWLGKLSELEVLILADSPNLVDASPLANLTELHYLEFFMNHNVEDYSFLNSLTKIQELNLCRTDHIGDMSFLAYMPDLKFLMVKYSDCTRETFLYWQEQFPNAYMVFYDGNIESCDSGWRDTEKNHMIRYAFSHWRYVTDYQHYDQVTYDLSRYNY